MAPALLNYLGFGGSAAAAEDEKSSVRALPAPWYTSEEMYQLERRAIFSRRWLLTTHQNRLKQAGDWLRYEIAGFNIIISKDRHGNINAFHNVCRHRAYPVVDEEKGTSKIFSCRYHGWSYGLDGKLAKAPGYQDLPSFDKTQNGLFTIHVHIDINGFIWINLDGKEKPEVPWEEDLGGADSQERLRQFQWDQYEFDHVWEIDAAYNWKIAADNYNECYHCKTTHPDIPTVADLASYSVNVQRAWIQHNGATTAEQRERGLTVCATYFWPNASFNVSPHFFFTQRFVPRGPNRTLVRYEVFRNKNSSEEDFQLINNIYKRIMSEDKVLCDAAQKNINTGVFVNGEMHPVMEKGPLYFQKLVREAVTEHHKREQAARTEIWPARQNLPTSALVTKKDIDFCSGLACSTNQEGLVW
ncbi:hypothetical protein PV08_07991 [Exophiala spinifera]|uniref:Choline monooxygenase, chloroplastic n=1 Tax=Exophiala spinifera TaxID=91928 RepID=A0A0D2BNV6_9EURO|nr:uncharacterized protein PV08_07991 [Exophiala spinifera]KIW12804.1 hypothetical protein PV08_07991 [Exophiala spinifera]